MLRIAAASLACRLPLAAAAAQVQRSVPADRAARRASSSAPRRRSPLNGQPARLAPGARIRDADNMAVVPGGAASAASFLVHYTVDTCGLVKDVWILTPEEAAEQPWPTTPEEAQAWRFDPVGAGLDQAVSQVAGASRRSSSRPSAAR